MSQALVLTRNLIGLNRVHFFRNYDFKAILTGSIAVLSLPFE